MSVRLGSGLALLGLLVACGGTAAGPGSEAATISERIAPGLRRLSSAELDAAATQLLGADLGLAARLPPDARQNDYSRNAAQTVDSLTLSSLYDRAKGAAAALDLSRPSFPACAAKAVPADAACEQSVVATLARRAFRRAPNADELAQLQALFELGSGGQSFSEGVAVVVRALLASPKFLYATTLGAAGEAGDISLTDDELASELAFLISGRPPDDALLDAASQGLLRTPSGREAQAVRLLRQADSRYLYRRFVEEWLGIVRLTGLAKSSSVVSDWSSLRGAMLGETDAFIDDVFANQNGSLGALFAGGYSIVPADLAAFYGIKPTAPGARVALDRLGRVGILQQASFLATFAHEDESAPVQRGKAVLIRILCRQITPPQEVGVDVHLPAPDPNATTRQRFAQHATNPFCATCHGSIDPAGFPFENFDAVGRLRQTENGQPVDTSGSILIDGRTLALGDSLDLSRALAGSSDAQACAARQVARFALAQSAPEVEDAFAAAMQSAPLERRASLTGLFLEFVKSDAFARRRLP